MQLQYRNDITPGNGGLGRNSRSDHVAVHESGCGPFSTVVAGRRFGRYWGKSRHRFGAAKTTSLTHRVTSTTTNCRTAKGLFDPLVGDREHPRWHIDAERARRLQIDGKFE